MNSSQIDDQPQWHFKGQDCPLALGLSTSGSLVVGSDAEKTPLIWIISYQGRFSAQPEPSRLPLLLNGETIESSTWLKDGDEITLGSLVVKFVPDADGATLFLRDIIDEEPEQSSPPPVIEDNEQSQRFGKNLFQNKLGAKGRLLKLTSTTKVILSVFLTLILGVTFVLIASPVYVRITPTPETISVTGFPPPIPIHDRYLALPGKYRVEAQATGYRKLKEHITVSYGSSPTFKFILKILPGFLSITTPPIKGASILVDGQKKGLSPLTDSEVEPGKREIKIISERYLPVTKNLEIRGKGERQNLEVKLTPGWGMLLVDSDPKKAGIKLNGKNIGITPLKAEPLQGAYELEFIKEGWKPVKQKIEIKAGITTKIETVTLERIDGTLDLKSTPSGATVMVERQYRGKTPTTFPLISEKDYQLKISKQGYTDTVQTIRVEGNKTSSLSVRLKPEYGTIFLTTNPPGAKLRVNGKTFGSASQRLKLQTVPQSLEIKKSGYVTYKKTVTPRKGISKKINVSLKTIGHFLKEKDKKGLKTSEGQRLRLIFIPKPARFLVGSSRREPGRRSNEIQYLVELSRSFWISEKEITNQEFKKFSPKHNSGSYRAISLNQPEQPAVNLSWEDAARYAIWLSKKEGLKPAYQEVGNKVVAVMPLTNGYRLPTEVEWEFASRYQGGKQSLNKPLRYPWGSSMPPPNNSGNYADDGSLKLPFAILKYIDGFPVSAPVGKFRPNKSLLYDLGGNVAEWCHDYYDMPLYNVKKPQRNPSGPKQGRFHVIKGSSWRSGSFTELRLSYRDYSEKPRNNVGFRIVRYVQNNKK